MTAPSGTPLIIQSDASLLVDVHDPGFEEARSELSAFAELEKANRAGKRLAELIAGGVDETGKPVGRLDRAYRSGELKRLVDSLVGPSEPEQAAAGSRVESGEVHDDPLGEAAGGGAVRVELPMEVPLINRVQAGYPTEFTDLGYPARVADEYVRCPDLRDPDAFAARVVGDSMAPEYKEGDIVVFSPQQTIENGMDCFARLEPDHTSTFKRVYFERGEGDQQRIRLQPINNSYPPQVLDREQVAGLYAAVTVMRSLV